MIGYYPRFLQLLANNSLPHRFVVPGLALYSVFPFSVVLYSAVFCSVSPLALCKRGLGCTVLVSGVPPPFTVLYCICIVPDDQHCGYEQMVTFLVQNAYERQFLQKKSGRFREFNSQKIFSKTRFDKQYLGKHHGI